MPLHNWLGVPNWIKNLSHLVLKQIFIWLHFTQSAHAHSVTSQLSPAGWPTHWLSFPSKGSNDFWLSVCYDLTCFLCLIPVSSESRVCTWFPSSFAAQLSLLTLLGDISLQSSLQVTHLPLIICSLHFNICNNYSLWVFSSYTLT